MNLSNVGLPLRSMAGLNPKLMQPNEEKGGMLPVDPPRALNPPMMPPVMGRDLTAFQNYQNPPMMPPVSQIAPHHYNNELGMLNPTTGANNWSPRAWQAGGLAHSGAHIMPGQAGAAGAAGLPGQAGAASGQMPQGWANLPQKNGQPDPAMWLGGRSMDSTGAANGQSWNSSDISRAKSMLGQMKADGTPWTQADVDYAKSMSGKPKQTGTAQAGAAGLPGASGTRFLGPPIQAGGGTGPNGWQAQPGLKEYLASKNFSGRVFGG